MDSHLTSRGSKMANSPEEIKPMEKTKMALSLEPCSGFQRFNFWLKALDIYFHSWPTRTL